MKWFKRTLIAAVLVASAFVQVQSGAQTKKKLPSNPHSQPGTALFHVRVKTDITFDGPQVDMFKQCIYRELRQIPEVTVVEDNTEYNRYTLAIVMLQTETQYLKNSGYAVAFAVSGNISTRYVDDMIAAETTPRNGNSQSTLRDFFSRYSTLDTLQVLTDSSLDSMCRRIVAAFDTGPIEEGRQVLQTVNKSK